MKTIVITYDEERQTANVIDANNAITASFDWNEELELEKEYYDSDNEDFNDNARWLIKTLLEIFKMEKNDSLSHCDWSADCERGGKYKFDVSIKNIGGRE